MTDAEVDALRAELALLQPEYDRWVTVALERRTELANLDATVTATMIALSDTGGADGWRPPRGVSPLIDRALDVREARDEAVTQIAELYKTADAAYRGGYYEGAENEQAAVVAWLRAWQGQMDDRITHDDADYAIRVIERGEHRRKGDE